VCGAHSHFKHAERMLGGFAAHMRIWFWFAPLNRPLGPVSFCGDTTAAAFRGAGNVISFR
jgi:hypothetical protein